jgi:hypothetical protein
MKSRSLWYSPAVIYTAFAAVFITFRLILFLLGTTASEYVLYQDYGEFARNKPIAQMFHERDIEYPHLAVWLGSAAAWVADQLPPGAHRWTVARPNPFWGESEARFEAGLSLILAAVDVACLAMVFLLARKLYPEEGVHRRVGRLLVYMVATGVLGPILYDRQDLVVAFFALAALLALVSGWTVPGYVLLVVGTAYKLVPALVLPVWVFAAAARRSGPNATLGRFVRATVIEAATAGAILLAWPVATYLFGGGERGFVFLTFHSKRGLQLEAPLAWPIMLLDPTAIVGHGYGSYNFVSPLGDAIAGVLKWAMLLSVAVTGLIAGRGYWRMACAPERPTSAALGIHAVASSVLVWMAFILTNKVGSPQYLLWVVPLIPLLPLRGAAAWCWAVLMVAASGLTSLVFPTFYKYVLGPRLVENPGHWAGPNDWCILLLTARSLTLLAATLWIGVVVWRSARPVPAAATVPSSSRSIRHDSSAAPDLVPLRRA